MKTNLGLLALVAIIAAPLALSAAGDSSKADWACVADATEVREDAIITAFSAFNADMLYALEARKDALVDANGTTDKAERQTERKDAWKTFKAAKKSASSEYKAARKDAFKDFAATVKTDCKLPAAAGEEKESSGGDPVL